MLRIFTDGSCIGNPGGPYGWSFLIVENETDVITSESLFFSGGGNNGTNNRAELTAILECLKWCEENNRSNIRIYTDSRYCVKSINQWMHIWVSNGWNGRKGEIRNIDLFKTIYPLAKKIKTHLEWVQGHSGHPLNEFVDGQAEKMALKYLENQFATYTKVKLGSKISMPVNGSKWHSHFKVSAKFESSATIMLSPLGRGKTQILSAEDFDNGKHILIG